jgi:hypothetical protein
MRKYKCRICSATYTIDQPSNVICQFECLICKEGFVGWIREGVEELGLIGSKHVNQLRHAVGFFSDNPGFRNAFHTKEDDKVWILLKKLGFADGGIERMGSFYYWVTDEGKALIGLEEQKIFKSGIDRDHERNIQDLCEIHEIEID